MTLLVIAIFIALIFLPSALIACKIKYDERKEKEKNDTQPRTSIIADPSTGEILLTSEGSVSQENADTAEEVSKENIDIKETPVTEESPEPKEKKKRGRKPGKKNKTTGKPRKKGGDQLLLS
jgi:hypothetical protein